MALSVAIHLALFIVVGWLLGSQSLPSMSDSVLLVNIAPPRADGIVADDKVVAPVAASETLKREENRKPIPMSVRPSDVVTEARMMVGAEMEPQDVDPLPASISWSSEADSGRQESAARVAPAAILSEAAAVRSDVDTATLSSDPVVITRASRIKKPRDAPIALSSKQQKMLSRKLRKWTENLHSMPRVASGLTWEHKGQEYLAKFTEVPPANDMGIQRVVVEISTEQDGKRMSTEVHMKRLAFSNYGQFVNRWDPTVQIHDDEMDGRFHSNTEISLTYDRKVKPLFHGKVTTTSRRINVTNRWGRAKRDQIFVGGLQTGVRAIRLPKRFLPFPGDGAMDEELVHRFGEDTRITFFADGSFAWQPLESESPQKVVAISRDGVYVIADKNVRLYVKGTVNGRVLVYSPERIVIEGNLIYEQNPEETMNADDYLGLVSDKYVDVAAPHITGPGDLLINAAIYAKRRFAVREYRAREYALLYLYGSLSVGTLSATEPRYSTKIRFDRRLEELRPPGFPMTNRYEVESWDEHWRVEPTG
jgi:hypothetical protein